jgi:ADP-ribosyl-[dinitrogen reductase] hydrolase
VPVRPVKTSLTHPLEILAVAVPQSGKIGMTLCPGKRQPHAMTGPWQRDLAMDMAAIAAFETRLLVSLMEAHEMSDAGVSPVAMREAATAQGIAWLHLPIADFQAPDADFESVWQRHRPDMLHRLQGGQNIVMHCRGGRGRSGTAAARLLVDLGFSAEAAIATVRKVNPLAMETDMQERYVRQLTK